MKCNQPIIILPEYIKLNNLLSRIILVLICFSCHRTIPDQPHFSRARDDVLRTEKSFAEMSLKKGIGPAFVTYADERAVLLRNNQLIKGKDAIQAYYEKPSFQHARLQWTPDFVAVSSSGDLAYTYGHYTFYSVDSTGNRTQISGIFHTVWKKQKDGSWRYVWD